VVRGSIAQNDTQGAGEGADIRIQNSNVPKVEYRCIFVERKTTVSREQRDAEEGGEGKEGGSLGRRRVRRGRGGGGSF